MKRLLVMALMVSGCGPEPTIQMPTEETLTVTKRESRIEVVRVDVFRDNLAYDGSRGIYIITDTKSGEEFIGISGIGISEIGSHPAGKVYLRDER